MFRLRSIVFPSLFTILFSTVFFHFVQAQTQTSSQVIREVRFMGLTKTKSSFLLPLLQSQPGQDFSRQAVLTDIQTLRNVESIGWATYHLEDSTLKYVVLIFEIEEIRTLLPIVNFGGLRDNFWFQLGFQDNNWLGRGRDLQVYYQNIDRRHSGQLFYREPAFKGGPWGYTFSLLKYASEEPLFFDAGTVYYNYDLYSLGGGLQRRIGVRRLAEIGATVFIEDYEQTLDQPLSDPPGPNSLRETKILGKLAYGEDFRNFFEFHLTGWQWYSQFQQVYNFRDQSLFLSSITTYKQFWRLGEKVNLAFRGRFGIATNRDSPFAPFVLDSYFNLRGVGNRIDRGTAQLVFNLEWRQTVYDEEFWAGQLVAFTDLGSWRNPGGELRELIDPDVFREFVGGGIRVVYKKVFNAVLRLDYGVDIFDPRSRGFVLGFGQYF